MKKVKVQNVPFGRMFVSPTHPDRWAAIPHETPASGSYVETLEGGDQVVLFKWVQSDGTYKRRGRWQRLPWDTLVEPTTGQAHQSRPGKA